MANIRHELDRLLLKPLLERTKEAFIKPVHYCKHGLFLGLMFICSY
jgi:hypothetical protein